MLMPLERMRVGMSSDEREPDADAGTHGVEGHEHVEAEGDQPAVAGVGHVADEGLVDVERRGLGGGEIGEGILEEGFDLVGGDATGARDSMSGTAAGSSERTKLVAAVKSP